MKRIQPLIILLLVALSLVACTRNQLSEQDLTALYLFDMEKVELRKIEVDLEFDQNVTVEAKARKTIERMIEEQNSSSIKGSIPEEAIPEIRLRAPIALVYFPEAYNQLAISEQTMIRAAMVYSLTEIEEIDGVEFFIGEKPLTNNRGNKVGEVARHNVILSGINPNPPTTTQTVTLYFTKEGTGKLYPETREINVSTNTPLERYVLEALIEGPREEGLIATLPSDTKINDIKTQDNVTQVDLSYSLQAKEVATPSAEQLFAYSIVNTLTEIPSINRVTFLRDGKVQDEGNLAVDFGNLLERDETLIEQD